MDTQTEVRRVLSEYPHITPFGCNQLQPSFAADPRSPKAEVWNIDNEQIERFELLIRFIHLNFTPAKALCSSYSLKHVIEKQNWIAHQNHYVSNGECMVAMIICGYKPKWGNEACPNVQFRVDPYAVFKQGQKRAKRIWSHRRVHSKNWESMTNEYQTWLEDDHAEGQQDGVMYYKGFDEMMEQLKRNMIFCGKCMGGSPPPE